MMLPVRELTNRLLAACQSPDTLSAVTLNAIAMLSAGMLAADHDRILCSQLTDEQALLTSGIAVILATDHTSGD